MTKGLHADIDKNKDIIQLLNSGSYSAVKTDVGLSTGIVTGLTNYIVTVTMSGKADFSVLTGFCG